MVLINNAARSINPVSALRVISSVFCHRCFKYGAIYLVVCVEQPLVATAHHNKQTAGLLKLTDSTA